jgi:hypothetical protein
MELARFRRKGRARNTAKEICHRSKCTKLTINGNVCCGSEDEESGNQQVIDPIKANSFLKW